MCFSVDSDPDFDSDFEERRRLTLLLIATFLCNPFALGAAFRTSDDPREPSDAPAAVCRQVGVLGCAAAGDR